MLSTHSQRCPLLLLILGVLAMTGEGVPVSRHQCPHHGPLAPASSAWAETLLQSDTFRPRAHRGGGGGHLARLRHKLAELEATIRHNKESLARTVFGDSYKQTDSELAGLHYHYFEDGDGEGGEDDFSRSYSQFQKLHISSEMVLADLRHYTNRHWEPRSGREVVQLWSSIHLLLGSVLKQLYIQLVHTHTTPAPPLARQLVPARVRCVPSTAHRDTRDFVILRHILAVSSHYSRIFDV